MLQNKKRDQLAKYQKLGRKPISDEKILIIIGINELFIRYFDIIQFQFRHWIENEPVFYKIFNFCTIYNKFGTGMGEF